MAPPTDPLGTATSSTFRAAKIRADTAGWAGRGSSRCPVRDDLGASCPTGVAPALEVTEQ